MTTHKQSLPALMFAAIPLFLPLQAFAAEPPPTRPNIIFIIADDLGYRNLECYGSKNIKTPNIDAMCADGIKFPKDTDGISIVPTLLGKGDQQKHEYLFWSGAVRMGNWKGVGKPGKLSLYDLSNDISETNDLAKQHPEIAAKLSDFMQKAWTEPRSQESDGTDTGGE